MSSPRYDWWGYVKGMIRRYPALCNRESELHNTSISPDLSGMPRGNGRHSDPVADAALRELPAVNQRELAAVQAAVAQTFALPDGKERLRMVDMVFWSRTHTLDGVAMCLNRHYNTVQAWHAEFIRAVAKNFGLL